MDNFTVHIYVLISLVILVSDWQPSHNWRITVCSMCLLDTLLAWACTRSMKWRVDHHMELEHLQEMAHVNPQNWKLIKHSIRASTTLRSPRSWSSNMSNIPSSPRQLANDFGSGDLTHICQILQMFRSLYLLPLFYWLWQKHLLWWQKYVVVNVGNCRCIVSWCSALQQQRLFSVIDVLWGFVGEERTGCIILGLWGHSLCPDLKFRLPVN